MAKYRTSSNEGELTPKCVKRLGSPQLLRINSLDLDKLHPRTLIKLENQMANHYGWSRKLEKCSSDFQKKKIGVGMTF